MSIELREPREREETVAATRQYWMVRVTSPHGETTHETIHHDERAATNEFMEIKSRLCVANQEHMIKLMMHKPLPGGIVRFEVLRASGFMYLDAESGAVVQQM